MNCSNHTNYLTTPDFDCIGQVAQHCSLPKLCVAIEEAKTFDLIPLFCFDFVHDVLENWNLIETDPNYQKYQQIICGGTYTDCGGRLKQNLGLKRVWIYYSYARYLLVNQFNDTANGTVRKQNDFSSFTDMKDIRALSDKYRNMGKEAFESLHGFLCANKNSYPKFDDCNCKLNCGCTGSCSCGKTKKLSGIKFSTVRK